MMEHFSFSLPLTGVVQYSASLLAGLLVGVIFVRSGLASSAESKLALQLKNGRILQTLLGAFLAALLLLPLLREFRTPVPAAGGEFWQCLLGGALCGAGLFFAGRTPLTALAGVFKGELSALLFLASAAGTVWLFDEMDISPRKWIAGHDFSTGNLSAASGWKFFDPATPALWIAAGTAVLLILVYFISSPARKGGK